MQRGVAFYALGEKLGPDIAKWNIARFMYRCWICASLLYEVPGGNLVDGLPPAASLDAELE